MDFSCWNTISALWEIYTTMLWPDWNCWTSQNMRHWTKLVTWSDIPSDNTIIEKWCYENLNTNCNNEWGLYTWAESMWFDPSCNTTSCTQIEDRTKSVCGQLWTWWKLPTDDQYLVFNDVWPAWWTWNKLSWIISSLPGFLVTTPTFFGINDYGYWWSSNESSSTNWWDRNLLSSSDVSIRNNNDKSIGFSVICIKN